MAMTQNGGKLPEVRESCSPLYMQLLNLWIHPKIYCYHHRNLSTFLFVYVSN